MDGVVKAIAALSRFIMDYLARLGLIALLALGVLGAVLAKWGTPTLAWVSVICGSLAVLAVRAYLSSQNHLSHKVMVVGAVVVLLIPPLWVALSAEEPEALVDAPE